MSKFGLANCENSNSRGNILVSIGIIYNKSNTQNIVNQLALIISNLCLTSFASKSLLKCICMTVFNISNCFIILIFSSLPSSQVLPCHPGVHSHSKSSPSTVHTPRPLQGSGIQGVFSEIQFNSIFQT